MVLATVIRLELAYPGVGIFAGDSIQYLTLASAHGVIMVFFMIMPLLFGAFGNFLLPTQLGVHDVAFPRLNSAAFWFLPGGLLMLCQLVCIDRRYQRMNCFNIREIESILKKKFFTDLINTHDYHNLFDNTILGIRYKLNDLNYVSHNTAIFVNYGLQLNNQIRSQNYVNSNNYYNKLNHTNNLIFTNILSWILEKSFLIRFFKSYEIFISDLELFIDWSLWYVEFENIFNKSLSIFFNFFNFFLININLFYFYIIKNFDLLSYCNIFLSINILFFQNNFLTCFYVKIQDDVDVYFNVIIGAFHQLFKIDFWNFHFQRSTKEKNIIINNYKNTITPSIQNSFLPNPINPSKSINFIQTYFWIKPSDLLILFNINWIIFESKLINFNFSNFSSIYHFIREKIIIFFYFIKNFNNLELVNIIFNINLKYINNDIIEFNSQNLKYQNNTIPKSSNYHIFFLFDFLKNIPFFFLNICKNLYNFENLISIFDNIYNFIIIWYIPLFLNDNLFFHLIKKLYYYFYFFNQNSYIFYLMNSIYAIFVFFGKFFSSFFFCFFNIFNYLFMTIFSIFTMSNLKFLYLNFIEIFFYSIPIISLKFWFNTFSTTFDSISSYFNRNNNNNILNFNTDLFNNYNFNEISKYSNNEISNSRRYIQYDNPIFKYDYKSGDYFPKINKILYTNLLNSAHYITGSIKQSNWYFSENFLSELINNSKNIIDKFSLSKNINIFKNYTSTSIKLNTNFINSNDWFFFTFVKLNQNNENFNNRWISLNSLNQKFYKFFLTTPLQQRIYLNWRQLKFTREAWRCKLLIARHQKTLFRRYIHEDGVFWTIERNAKDLIPGWAMITPFTTRTRFTVIGKVDVGLMGVFLVLNASIISSANFLVTYRYLSTLNNRKMRDARAFFTEGVMVASGMMIAANPMLAIGILMLLSDRHWQTSFFDYSGGGDTVLFQHMFWFFGHPEVYIIMIPVFGFTNTLLSYFLRKRVSARTSLIYSMYTIAFLGFFVWGHHMYMVGLAHTTRMLFSTLTVMISVPAATKIMHWCVTIANSTFHGELPLIFTLTFVFFFVSGGISGMCVAHTGMDVLFHDTFYVIGHFHVMLAGGAMFGSFGAFYFYFPAIFGVKYSRIFAYFHYIYYLLGQLMTVIPMFWLGYAGMPRRVLDYPSTLGGWHSVITAGHLISVAGIISFFIMIFDSLRKAKPSIRNTFGVGRYNVRLNFYLYENAKLYYIERKSWNLFKILLTKNLYIKSYKYRNFEPLETVLFNYTFLKKN